LQIYLNTQQSQQHGTYTLQQHCNHIIAFVVAFQVHKPTAPRATSTNQINCHRNPRAVCFCSTVRTNNKYLAPPINWCRSRCHDTNIIANHTCTLAVKGHQQQDTQTNAYSNPRTQSLETHGVSTKDRTADIANLPKHTTIIAAQNVHTAAPLQSYCRISPPTNSCRSRCHDTNAIANHTCTLAVKAHQQQDTQTKSRLQQ